MCVVFHALKKFTIELVKKKNRNFKNLNENCNSQRKKNRKRKTLSLAMKHKTKSEFTLVSNVSLCCCENHCLTQHPQIQFVFLALRITHLPVNRNGHDNCEFLWMLKFTYHCN